MARRTVFAAIDVGSTKIATVVGAPNERGMLQVLGVGVTPSAGIEKGQVSNIAKAVEAIETSVQKAERSSGTRILSAGVSLSGSHLSSLNNRGIVAVPDAGRPISADDAARVIDAARTISLKSNREMIHALPRYFVVDGQDRVSDPEGMHGQRLDVEMHIVTAGVNAVQNLMKCVEGAGVQVETLIASPLATGAAVLGLDEIQEGVALLDIGGGTTDLAVYQEGAIVHSAVLPVGGVNVTRDLVVGLRCPFAVAEDAKAEFAHALPMDIDGEEQVTLAAFGQEEEREIRRRLIAEIVEARVEEILSMGMAEIRRSGHIDTLSAGLVLSGGTAMLPGITTLAEQMTGLPARVGAVSDVYGLVDQVSDSSFATTLGLLLWMADSGEPRNQPMRLRMSAPGGVLSMMRSVGRIGRVFLPQ